MARILGIDIDKNVVRGTWLKTAFRNAEVTHYVEAFVGEARDPQGQAEQLRAAIQSVLNSGERPADSVIAELDGPDASVRPVEIPPGAAKRVDEVLPFELEPLIPFAIEDCIVDHQPIEKTATTLKLLAAAAPKARIAQRLAELADAGVDPRELAIGAAALDGLVHIIPALETPGPHIVIDVRSDHTDVCLLRNGHCDGSRTLSEGLAAIEAGRAQALERDLKHTLAAYRLQQGGQPSEGWVAGLTATPEWIDWFARTLAVPMKPLPLPEAVGADENSRSRFARSAALAGRMASQKKRLNARQGEFAPQRSASAIRQQVRLIAGCAAAIFLAFSFATFARWSALDDQREALRAQLADRTAALFETRTADPGRARTLVSGGGRGRDPIPEFNAFDAIAYLNELIVDLESEGDEPTQLRHDVRRVAVEINDDPAGDGSFLLRGIVDSSAVAARIQQRLASHRCFHEVEDPRTTNAPDDRRNYEINAIIRCGQRPTKNRSKNQNGDR